MEKRNRAMLSTGAVTHWATTTHYKCVLDSLLTLPSPSPCREAYYHFIEKQIETQSEVITYLWSWGWKLELALPASKLQGYRGKSSMNSAFLPSFQGQDRTKGTGMAGSRSYPAVPPATPWVTALTVALNSSHWILPTVPVSLPHSILLLLFVLQESIYPPEA